jgi:anti-sigma regulatory factor (Ser/Thr protein kinase)/serine/threonine protein phosphatase PrpC
MGGAKVQTIAVNHLGQVPAAQVAAREFAGGLGFDARECDRIALVASELATNLVTHGGGGTLTLDVAREGERAGIQLVAEDDGPGIADPERALTDGYSTAGGLGLGLGTVHRLMDDLEFTTPPRGGLRVVCRRWIRPPGIRAGFPLLDCGVATRPRRAAKENGDAFVVKYWAGHALVGVLDGLGHGELAQQAAQQGRLFLEEHCDQPLDRLFAGVDRVCRRTRGLVMALVRFDLGAGQFDFASVGNVEARLFGSDTGRNFIVRRGILGLQAPRPVVTTHAWTPVTVLVLHSDGVTSHWHWQDFPLAVWAAPSEAAQRLVQTRGRPDDDATVVVVRHARSGH